MTTPKLIKIVIIVIVICSLINFVRAGDGFPIARVLPFLGGYRPGIYDAGACVLLFIAMWGLGRLRRQGRD